MRQNFLAICIFYFLLTTHLLPLTAQESAGTSAVASLLIPFGARSLGMGDAGVALVSGVNGLHYNPAALAHIKRPEAAFAYQSVFLDSSLGHAGWAKPLKFKGLNELGGAALLTEFLYFDKGKIEVNQLNSDGSLNSSLSKSAGYDAVVGVGYAEHFLKGSFGFETLEEGDHSLGVIVKAVQSNLVGSYDAQAIAFDVGYLGRLENFSVGLAISNVGSRLKFINESDPLPASLRVGFSYGWAAESYSFLYALDALHQEGAFHGRGGLELALFKLIKFRGGWRFEEKSYQGGPTFGFGLEPGPLTVDYAFGWHGDLKDTHQLALALRF